ncbi:MAG: 2-hydroxychromene-2-carboxylate isomerase [Methyloligellaceae bacterium]
MTLAFDLYWSMRSPYCYIALDRVLEIRRSHDVDVNLRVIYPIAIRDPDFFRRAPAHYRPYHLLDSQRAADFQGIPYRRPVPDPIVQDMETQQVAAEQPYIRRLTRLAAAAAEAGKGLEFLDKVMRLLWDGQSDGWDKGSHLADAIDAAGLESEALMRDVAVHPETYDLAIEANQKAQLRTGHPGVPLFVFEGEPFFGQDHIDVLVWRMTQKGLEPRR